MNFLFQDNSGEDGFPDMHNVRMHSDRGYLSAKLVFEYLMQSNAEIVGTVKRAGCWPFTFQQKVKSNDKRTMLYVKGSPALFVKKAKDTKLSRLIHASAFRNGTDKISTAVSTLHRGHHWEGIGLIWSYCHEYKQDSQSLQKYAFSRKIEKDNEGGTTTEVDVMNKLFESVIPFTLTQGSADQHWGRKLHWKRVATYFYGPDWRDKFPNLVNINNVAGDGAANESGDGAANEAGDGAANETGDRTANEARDGTANEAGDGTANEAGDGTANEAGDGTTN